MLGPESRAAPEFSMCLWTGAVPWQDCCWETWRLISGPEVVVQGQAETDTQGIVTLREPSPAGTGHKGGGIRHTRSFSQGNLTPG